MNKKSRTDSEDDQFTPISEVGFFSKFFWKRGCSPSDAPRQWNGLTARDADRGESNSSESGL